MYMRFFKRVPTKFDETHFNIATHYNTATHCNTLQNTETHATHFFKRVPRGFDNMKQPRKAESKTKTCEDHR